MEITQKWLSDIGGWQMMKTARAFHSAGAVHESQYFEETDARGKSRWILKGQVVEGKTTYSSGFAIRTKTDVDTRCSCLIARRGLVCPHALAVGLEWLTPQSRKSSSHPSHPASQPGTRPSHPLPGQEPPKNFPVFRIVLPEAFPNLLKKGSLPFQFVQETGNSPAYQAVGQVLTALGLFNPNLPRHVGEYSPMATLPAKEAGVFLKCLTGLPSLRLRLKNGTEIPFEVHPPGPASTLEYRLTPNEEIIFTLLENSEDTERLLQDQWEWHPVRRTLTPVNTPSGAAAPILSILRAKSKSPSAETAFPLRAILPVWEELSTSLQLVPQNPDAASLRVLPATPTPVITLEGTLRQLEITLQHRYEIPAETASVPSQSCLLTLNETEPSNFFPFPANTRPNTRIHTLWHVRYSYVERLHRDQLLKLGFKAMDGSDSRFKLTHEESILTFLSTTRRELSAQGWQAIDGPRLAPQIQSLKIIRPLLAPLLKEAKGGNRTQYPSSSSAPNQGGSTQGDWLNFSLQYVSDDGAHVPRSEILRLLRGGGAHKAGRLTQVGGRRALMDLEAIQEMEQILLDSGARQQSSQGMISLKREQAAWISESDFVKEALTGSDDGPSQHVQAEALAHIIRPVSPHEIEPCLGQTAALLRPYQWEGICWMSALAEAQLGGVLADEMGLGKTLQSLALIQHLQSSSVTPLPSLVVCPTSLLPNWADEAAKFFPNLRVNVWHGSDRGHPLEGNPHLILTSYGLLARDIETLHPIAWSVVILDEASLIKNPDTQTARAARRLQAQSRFALTGTPIENSVRDWWSLFSFVLPGYLGSKEDFHQRYILPLSSGTPDPSVLARLRRRVKPYTLRRLKRAVASELPPRIEQIHWCHPTPFQQGLYRQILHESRAMIDDKQRKQGKGAARLALFTALLRLRQICNDPRLSHLETAQAPSALSPKWDVLDELLHEIEEAGEKAILFSQFTGMLDLVEAWLPTRETSPGLRHVRLDGSTADRRKVVKAFQEDSETRLFLISLKAGGYGLNLTAADHVILIDPWWNPAVEAQAIDRAHRLGREHPVHAHRLILKGTVEERILSLQEKKRQVAHATLDVPDETVEMTESQIQSTGLTERELEDLLSE